MSPGLNVVSFLIRGKVASWFSGRHLASHNMIVKQLEEQVEEGRYSKVPDNTPFWIDMFLFQPERINIVNINSVAMTVIEAARGMVYTNPKYLQHLFISKDVGDEFTTAVRFSWITI